MQRCETSLKRERQTDTQWALASNGLKCLLNKDNVKGLQIKEGRRLQNFP